MKLTVVQPDDAHELIPKIAQYANTQNKIDIADFFSNHPFHRKMADIAVRLRVPAKPGVRVQSKWFYERSRGQYQNERLYLTKSKKEQRDLEFPPSQVINKTDLAKYDSTWREKPYWACLGVQKNIRNFAKQFESVSPDLSESEHWNKISTTYGDSYYERIVVIAILWKATEKMVSTARQDWYKGDYRAQIVAYALAMFLKSFRNAGSDFDTNKVWLKQEPDRALLSFVEAMAMIAQSVITSPSDGGTNFGEWAKKEACWQRCLQQVGSLPTSVHPWRMERDEVVGARKDAKKAGKIDDGFSVQKKVLEFASNGYWASLYAWEKLPEIVVEPDRRLIGRVLTVPGCLRVATEREWRRLIEISRNCEDEGFRHH
jgi:predicted nucleic acid-binding protein